MSDETPMPQQEKTGTRSPSTGIIIAALALVLIAGIGIGYAVTRNGERGGSGTTTETPTIGGAPTGPTQPGQTAPGTRPTAPVAEGSSLATISTPPEQTLAMVDASKLGADATYAITFSPFGYGPPQGGTTVVIRIATAEPNNESAKAMDLNGRNMLAVLGQQAEVAAGGTYTGTLTFRPQGDLLIPVIADVAAK